jgi:hypothetical protein
MRNTCIVEGCGKAVHGQGYCKKHYLRWMRHGDPNKTFKIIGDPSASFWSKVDKNGPEHPIHGKCWIWVGGLVGGMGYGGFRSLGKPFIAHRYSWEIHFGDIPDDLWVLHKCDNPPCVNPDHLFLGDCASNTADKVSKGRQAIQVGEDNPFSILTEEQVIEIRRIYKGKCKVNGANALALKFGVSYSTIKAVVYGKNWKHLPTK